MTSPALTAGTSSSRHFRQTCGGDPRPDLAGDFCDDQDLRMGESFPLTRAARPRPAPWPTATPM
jgi:hypothetical protein